MSACRPLAIPALSSITRPLELERIAELDSIPGQGLSTLPTTCPGAGYRLPCHFHVSGQVARLFAKDSPHWRGNVDTAVWSVRRLYALRVFMPCGYLCPSGIYALRVPGSLNLNRNAARFTLICCPWMLRASPFFSSGKSLMSITSRAGSAVSTMFVPDVGNVTKASPTAPCSPPGVSAAEHVQWPGCLVRAPGQIRFRLIVIHEPVGNLGVGSQALSGMP
jgi:hypothetical protein